MVVLVKSGALTYYQGSGSCVGRVYPAGTAFLDSGDGRAHIANNESGVTTETSVVYFGVPEGTSPRIDEPRRPAATPDHMTPPPSRQNSPSDEVTDRLSPVKGGPCAQGNKTGTLR